MFWTLLDSENCIILLIELKKRRGTHPSTYLWFILTEILNRISKRRIILLIILSFSITFLSNSYWHCNNSLIIYVSKTEHNFFFISRKNGLSKWKTILNNVTCVTCVVYPWDQIKVNFWIEIDVFSNGARYYII